MELQPLQKTHFSDDTLSRFQDALSSFLDQLKSNPMLVGALLEDVSLASGPTSVPHKLGTKARGYIVVKKSAQANIYDTAIDENYLYLTSSAAVTVSIWAF